MTMTEDKITKHGDTAGGVDVPHVSHEEFLRHYNHRRRGLKRDMIMARRRLAEMFRRHPNDPPPKTNPEYGVRTDQDFRACLRPNHDKTYELTVDGTEEEVVFGPNNQSLEWKPSKRTRQVIASLYSPDWVSELRESEPPLRATYVRGFYGSELHTPTKSVELLLQQIHQDALNHGWGTELLFLIPGDYSVEGVSGLFAIGTPDLLEVLLVHKASESAQEEYMSVISLAL